MEIIKLNIKLMGYEKIFNMGAFYVGFYDVFHVCLFGASSGIYIQIKVEQDNLKPYGV